MGVPIASKIVITSLCMAGELGITVISAPPSFIVAIYGSVFGTRT